MALLAAAMVVSKNEHSTITTTTKTKQLARGSLWAEEKIEPQPGGQGRTKRRDQA